MYNNTNNNNKQAFRIDEDGFPIGAVVKKAMTKARANLDGNGSNRGILIHHTQTGQERWVSVNTINEVCKMPFGSTIYFHGKGQRPSLTTSSSSSELESDTPPNTTDPQVLADYYSRKAQQSVYESYQPEADYETSYNEASESINDIDAHLVEKLGVLFSDCCNLAMSLNPNLSEESQVKIAISMGIAYQKIKGDVPF